LGAELHDVGKIGVSEGILHKAGKLSEVEYRHIMEHPVIGARILGPLMRDAPGALSIVRSHHERFDGKGLPDGLAGEAIPFEARVVAVADAFDAMTSVRPYRPSLQVSIAMKELEEGKGVQFDPAVVDAFRRAFPELKSLPIPTPQLQPLRLPVRAMEARRA
jgi:HD-GYP domain-containing protein (c-di-GMP phosphodiesterase class II)